MVFRKLLWFVLAGFPLALGYSQQASSSLWQEVSEATVVAPVRGPAAFGVAGSSVGRIRSATPEKYRTVAVNQSGMSAKLSSALPDVVPSTGRTGVIRPDTEIQLPLPEGGFGRFFVMKSPILNPTLAAQFPQIQSFTLRGIDDPSASGRLSISPRGLEATVVSRSGTSFIKPYWRGDPNFSIVYSGAHLNPGKYGRSWKCATPDSVPGMSLENLDGKSLLPPRQPSAVSPRVMGTWGSQIRIYRLALACNGEFAAQVCPPNPVDVLNTLSFVNDSISTISAIYERDLAIQFELVTGPTNDLTVLLYTNATTDPYTTYKPFQNDGILAKENQTNIDTLVGSSNYQFGHLYTAADATSGISYGSGLGPTFGIIGDDKRKAMCISTRGAKDNTLINFDLVAAHEMGHGSGANHVFSHSLEATTAQVEPGSGSTIMSYAGIVPGYNLQADADDYFNAKSLEQIIAYTSVAPASTVGQVVQSANTPPVVAVPVNRIIPAQTPFVLTASATDADGDPLTYTWEAQDSGAKNPTTSPRDNGIAPLFRSFPPTTNPARTFPSLRYILQFANIPPPGSGVDPDFATGEFLPTTDRTMKFRITARDGDGGVSYQNCTVQSVASAGPFLITNLNTSNTLSIGSLQTLKWSFRNTGPGTAVNCTNVKITYSTNGGTNFDGVLAASTPITNGSYTFTVPNLPTNVLLRFKVESLGNIFFDVNNADLQIRPLGEATPFDNFAEASIQPLSGNLVEIRNSSRGATAEVGEPAYLLSPEASVWFRFTPDYTGHLELGTAGSDFDTALSVYRANTNINIAFTNLVWIGGKKFSNAATNALPAFLKFPVTNNEIYYVSLDGVGGAMGSYVLTARPILPPIPFTPSGTNDFLKDATAAGSDNFTCEGTLVGKTAEAGEMPLAGLRPTNSVWFRWVAPVPSGKTNGEIAGKATFSTEFSSADTVLGAYVNTATNTNPPTNPATLRLVAANDNFASSLKWSQVVFSATAGTAYLIKVDGRSATNYRLTGRFEPDPILRAPTNISLTLGATPNPLYVKPLLTWDAVTEAKSYEVYFFRTNQRIAVFTTAANQWTNAPDVAKNIPVKYGAQIRTLYSNGLSSPWSPLISAP